MNNSNERLPNPLKFGSFRGNKTALDRFGDVRPVNAGSSGSSQ
jgi:hypothetical protein